MPISARIVLQMLLVDKMTSCGCGNEKKYSLTIPHVATNAHPILGVHMPNFSLIGP